MLLSHVFDLFQSVYQWIVKPQTIIKSNEMFLPGRMTFVYDMVMLFTFFFLFLGRFNHVICSIVVCLWKYSYMCIQLIHKCPSPYLNQVTS